MLRLAGLLTQLACAGCLLLGTIAFVLIQQNKSGGTGYVIAWASAAMIALVFGGLMVRGGLISLLIAALLDIAFGSVLLVMDTTALGQMLRVLSTEDVAMVADILFIVALSMIGLGVLCFASIPQAIRYGRWLHAGESGELSRVDLPAQGPGYIPTHIPSAASTDRGFPPPPVPATGRYDVGRGPKSSMWLVPAAPIEERKSRRRMYFALGGFAIGFGAGIGVLVSSSTRSSASEPVATATDTPASGSGKADPTKSDGPKPPPPKNAGSGSAGSASGSAGSGSAAPAAAGGSAATGSGSAGSGSAIEKPPDPPSTPASGAKSVQAMLQDQRAAIARGDVAGVVATLAPNVAGFGIDADEVGFDKATIQSQLTRDLGELKDGTVEVKFSHLGQEGKFAWSAEELELSAPGKPTRRVAVTQLAGEGKAGWQVLAWHWAVPVRDDVAERRSMLGTKPAAKAIASKLEGPKDLDAAVRDAFSSKKAFAAARSERDDGFNFGSGPSERIVGGAKIKSIFGSLRAEIRLHDSSAHVVAASPTVAFALLNADFSHKTRAMTELTLTFRVFAVLVKEGSEWKLVLTQWSHGGPLR